MEVKNKIYQFAKMIKDIIPDKVPEGVYYNARNIRFVSADKEINSGFHFEKGNNLSLTLPRPSFNYDKKIIKYTINIYDEEGNLTGTQEKTLKYAVEVESTNPYGLPRNEIERTYYAGTPMTYYLSQRQRIIGYIETRKGVVLFSTDNRGFDCIWYLKDINNTLDIELLYMRNMGFSIEHPIEALNNYENEKIDKIYWVDTVHQLRHLNLEHSIENGDYEELIDLELTLIDAVSSIDLSQPQIVDVTYGGNRTAGMVQYGYTLYKLNGSQTSLSPLTNLVPLGRSENQGGNINEMIGAAPIVEINNLDTTYDNIIVYSIVYTSLNAIPQVSVIEDRTIPSSGSIKIYDNGNILRTSTLEELQFINTSLTFPGTIASKDNHLFIADFKEVEFEVKLDVRAYQFPKEPSHSARVYSNIKLDNNNELIGDIRDIHSVTTSSLTAYTDDPDDKFDSINLGYDYYMYQGNRSTRGGEGKYVKFELATTSKNENGRGKFFKDNEIYRLGIKFYNKYGQETQPMWVCDFKAPQGNLEGKFNILKFQLKPEFNVWLNNQNFDDYSRPVGYKVLMAERTNNDKTILASGLVSPMIISTRITDYPIVWQNEQDATYPVADSTFDDKVKAIVKMPSPLLRNAWLDRSYSKMMKNETFYFELLDSPMQRAKHHSALFWGSWENRSFGATSPENFAWIMESPNAFRNPSLKRYSSYQDTKTMQLYCPEAIFGTLPSLVEDASLEVRYGVLNVKNGTWNRTVDIHTNNIIPEFEMSVENILNPFIPHANDNTYPVEWIVGNENYGFNLMQGIGGKPYSGYFFANLDAWISWGVGGRGMFTNMFIDDIKGAHHLTVLQLFYRKYGSSLEEYDNSGLVISDDIKPGTLPQLISSDNKLTVLNGKSATTLTHDSNNITSNITTINDLVNVKIITKSGTVAFTRVDFKLDDQNINTPYTDGIVLELNKDIIVATDLLQSNISLNITDAPNDLEVEVFMTIKSTYKDSSNTQVSQIVLNNNKIIKPGIGVTFNLFQPAIIKPGTKNVNNITSHKIYGKPIYSKFGSGITNYNGNGYFKVTNNLSSYMNDELGGTNNDADKAIRKMNVSGVECITFVVNPEAENDHKLAKPYEQIVDEAKFLANSKYKNGGSIYCDIVKSRTEIYLGGIYGGNSYEDRQRTYYLEIGDYYKVNTLPNTILSPGDTFVQDFKFLRMVKGSQTALDTTVIEHEEIVEYLTETTIDLMNRSDDSILQWNSQFSYDREEYMKYNKVYSQQNIIGASRPLDYTFKKIDTFGSTIRASRVKTPGELYDSWLQSLINETIDLDGKYGKITRLLNWNDNIFPLQERAISVLSINPKVQVTSNEGYAIQMGTGKVLDDYKYVTTTSGSLKWSNVVTPYGIYYVDSRNKTFNLIGSSHEEVSRTKGFIKWFKDNVIHQDVEYDNIYLAKGIIIGYDKLRTELYITYKSENNNWTLGYNISQDSFSSFYDYNSDNYIPVNDKMLSINPNKTDDIYTMYEGKPTTFYKEQKGAEITFIANPEHLTECTFHNLEYVDRSHNEDAEETVYTFNKIEVVNEFQNSGTVALTPRINIRKLNRKWRIALPRNNNKVSRMRNNWVKITLRNDNVETQDHELNDFVLYYTPNYKKLQ